ITGKRDDPQVKGQRPDGSTSSTRPPVRAELSRALERLQRSQREFLSIVAGQVPNHHANFVAVRAGRPNPKLQVIDRMNRGAIVPFARFRAFNELSCPALMFEDL